jgi:hypothetical protein
MADKVSVVLPRDPWPFSTVSVGDLEALIADGLLCLLSGEPQPEWMAPGSGVGPSPPRGYVVSFIPFHERGVWRTSEPLGVCYPAGPLVWRLFIPAGLEPESRLYGEYTGTARRIKLCRRPKEPPRVLPMSKSM